MPSPAIGAASWARLKQPVREVGHGGSGTALGHRAAHKADWLRICADGPILLIWPKGTVYGGVSPERIERIQRQNVVSGLPDWAEAPYATPAVMHS